MSNDTDDVIFRWRQRVMYDFPEGYERYLSHGDYLAAFLLACNLVEFYLIQLIAERALVRRIPHKNPSWYVKKGYALGRLIGEAKEPALQIDPQLLSILEQFNKKRRLLMHNMLWPENLSKSIDEEAEEACNEAGQVWAELSKHLSWLQPSGEAEEKPIEKGGE